MSLNILVHVIPWHSNSFTVIMMNDMALMISWMSSWWHPNSWWHFDYHRMSPLNRGVMSWKLTNCIDSSTAWYHKIPVCFGQTWQSPWWYQEKNGDIHEIDHDIQNLTMTPQSRFNCLRWRDRDIHEYHGAFRLLVNTMIDKSPPWHSQEFTMI